MAKKSVNSLLGAIKQAGFTKLGFIAGAVLAYIFGLGAIAHGLIGVAIYVNANTIWKYILKGADKTF